MVYVISQEGKPLMPCSNVIARLLLKNGKAKVKKREPFTIKLTYKTTNYTQNLTLGVDTGSGTLGSAVVRDNGDVVYMSEVTVRNDITDKMTQRAGYRRNRRNRKTRYRKARWLNRASSMRDDRFSPTMKVHIIFVTKYRKKVFMLGSLADDVKRFLYNTKNIYSSVIGNTKYFGQMGILPAV